MRRPVRVLKEPELDGIRLRSEGFDKYTEKQVNPQGRPPERCKIGRRQNGLTTTRITIRIMRTVGTSLRILKNFCDLRRRSAAKSFT